ncbi:MAG: hypothetical protein U1F30_14480 [Steroidobacteraceae bacterium]
MRTAPTAATLALLAAAAHAGPPYQTDDPQPTPAGHYEVYFFAAGASAHDGHGGTAGIDFNYGAAPDLQLTAVLPYAWDDPAGAPTARGLAGIELAAKYRFIHQADAGLDVAVFPRLILPAIERSPGERHASLLLPVWLQRSGERWSAFGGGGCALHRGGDARDTCMLGLAASWQATSRLQLGAEIHHETPAERGAYARTGLGFGLGYDLGERWHLLAAAGPGIQNRMSTDRTQWYASCLLTL